jgi:hypothetical protein
MLGLLAAASTTPADCELDQAAVRACMSPVPDVSATGGWQSRRAPQEASSELFFEVMARPTAANLNGLVAIGSGDINDFSDAAILVRFAENGEIDARDGSQYFSDRSIPYVPGVWYTMYVTADVVAETYKVEVSTCGGSRETLISRASFRSDAPSGQPLSNWAVWSSQGTSLEVSTPAWTAAGSCAPATCESLAHECGQPSDGCGGNLACGSCGAGQVCTSGVCVDDSTPPPTSPSTSTPTPTPTPTPSTGFPTYATTGITEEWCPRWDSLKRVTSGRTVTAANTVIEYERINGKLNIDANNVTVRCVEIVTGSDVNTLGCSNNGNPTRGCDEGFLIEDAKVYTTGGNNNAPFMFVTDEASGRRVQVYGGCDEMKMDGGYLRDSLIDGNTNYSCNLSGPHTDVWQSSGSSGPIWMVNNTMIGPYRSQNGTVFIKTDSGQNHDYTIDGCQLSGGSFTVWARNGGNGIPFDWRFTNNTIIENSYTYGAFDIEGNGPSQCIEWSGNVWDDKTPATGGPSNVKPIGGCSGVTPIPTWSVGALALTGTSCTRGQAGCDNVDLRASASGSQNGGSPRWRFNCGGSAGNTGGRHPDGADLWYDYTPCNGQSSCTMTDVCDYSGEAAGTYRVRIYSESGPGSRTRISDTSEASFVVNN